VNNATSRIAALIAYAILGALVVTVFEHKLTALIDTLHLSVKQENAIIDQIHKFTTIELPTGLSNLIKAKLTSYIYQASIFSFRVVFAGCAFLTLLAVIIATLIREKRFINQPAEKSMVKAP